VSYKSPNIRIESIDPFDRELLRFVLNWAPYGGPPDEVLPRFGIRSSHLHVRVDEIIRAGLERNLRIADRIFLHQVRRELREYLRQPI
jgi:hypothetical protein